MDKRALRKLISDCAAERGFVKVATGVFSRAAADGDTVILLRIPDMIRGFLLGVQFRSLGLGDWKDNLLTSYRFEALLSFADRRDYTKEEVITAAETVFCGVEPYLSRGKQQICEDIDCWMIRPQDFQRQNEVRAHLGLQADAPYSEAHLQYLLDTLSGGGGMRVQKEAYFAHADFFGKLMEKGFRVIDEDHNWIHLVYRSANRR